MNNKDGSLGPANNYDIQNQHFDSIGNAFKMLKDDLSRAYGRFRPVEELDGLTMRFLGRHQIQITHAKYAVGDAYSISKTERPHASQFLDTLVSELKKKYQKITSSPLKLKQQSEAQDLQLYSKLSPDRSYLQGVGGYQPNMGRYVLTTSRVYDVDAANLG